jgi:outer membrane protein TolC
MIQDMKKNILIIIFTFAGIYANAQLFNNEVKRLYQQAASKNDTLQLYQLKKEEAAIDIQSARFNYLPKVNFNATYTRLNDDIVFPDNLQQLLMGTQSLLIKEKLGLGFNSSLPGNIPLQPVDPIQRKDIFKTTVSSQWLLFSGFKVSNGIKAYQHQQKSVDHLTQKQQTKLWLDVADIYDKMALVNSSDAILAASEKILNEQARFVNKAIENGLATPLERKRIDLATQKLSVKKLENETTKTVLYNKMHQLTGVDIEAIQQLQPGLQVTPMVVTESAETRPEIKALNEGIMATKYQEKAALSDYVPKLAAFGQYEIREKDLSLLEPKWYAGVRLQWNVFDGFSARNNAKKATLQRRALEVQKKSAEDLFALADNKLKEDYLLATQKVKWKQASIQLTEDTYDFINKQYINGLTSLTEVLDALTDVETARFEYQQAVYEQRRAVLQMADINGSLLKNL